MLGYVDTLLLGNMAPPTSVSPGFLSVSYPDYNTKYKHPLGTRTPCRGQMYGVRVSAGLARVPDWVGGLYYSPFRHLAPCLKEIRKPHEMPDNTFQIDLTPLTMVHHGAKTGCKILMQTFWSLGLVAFSLWTVGCRLLAGLVVVGLD